MTSIIVDIRKCAEVALVRAEERMAVWDGVTGRKSKAHRDAIAELAAVQRVQEWVERMPGDRVASLASAAEE